MSFNIARIGQSLMTVMMGIKQKWNKLCRAIPDNRLVSLAVTTVMDENNHNNYFIASVSSIALQLLHVLYFCHDW